MYKIYKQFKALRYSTKQAYVLAREEFLHRKGEDARHFGVRRVVLG